jgi:hypothetical protein
VEASGVDITSVHISFRFRPILKLSVPTLAVRGSKRFLESMRFVFPQDVESIPLIRASK